MKRKSLIDFYKETDYTTTSLSIRGIAPRPSEWNVPLFIKNVYPTNIDLFKKSFNNNQVEIELDQQDLDYFKALLLHESLFYFYKAFYNYLCALKLYDGGLQHWIEITAYYAKFYLANSIITLAGKSRYIVTGSSNNFVEEIYKLVNSKGYHRNINKNGRLIPSHAKYGIEIEINPFINEGKLRIINNLGSGGSHGFVWKKYLELHTEEFDITKMTYSYPQHLSDHRNLENYSFEGYKQLDFNLEVENFKGYFQRDYIKEQSKLIYTSETAIILGVIGELFNLYEEFQVSKLPIEKEKLIYMCRYTLGDSEQSRKLADLIDSGFPSKNKYLDEYYWYEEN
ncbi:hypothetical protein DCC39_18515 [Pueribacillus theae]|uniref:Uncharacterized protein n=1 Tax=Pueribacillus theae TaxID=2171751 RepID=A0A2U1JIY8_9BACI|nr:hypothetical protein [Pueribacillus theae]PWA04975.1 hypothetical protein DCC39_18515 [Pueribacillus theae]